MIHLMVILLRRSMPSRLPHPFKFFDHFFIVTQRFTRSSVFIFPKLITQDVRFLISR